MNPNKNIFRLNYKIYYLNIFECRYPPKVSPDLTTIHIFIIFPDKIYLSNNLYEPYMKYYGVQGANHTQESGSCA